MQRNPRVLESSETAVHSLGLCTGLIPAAVAAVSRNSEDVHKFGLEIIAICIRLMEGVRSRSQKIEAAPGAWAYTVVGAGAEDSKAVLDNFHQAQVYSQSKVERDHTNKIESTRSQSRFYRGLL